MRAARQYASLCKQNAQVAHVGSGRPSHHAITQCIKERVSITLGQKTSCVKPERASSLKRCLIGERARSHAVAVNAVRACAERDDLCWQPCPVPRFSISLINLNHAAQRRLRVAPANAPALHRTRELTARNQADTLSLVLAATMKSEKPREYQRTALFNRLLNDVARKLDGEPSLARRTRR